jgi:hypothetical protein
MLNPRIKQVMTAITKKTVFGSLIEPAHFALERVRYHQQRFTSISMEDFISLGVLRHLQQTTTLREQVQALFHMSEECESTLPVARSTLSDALSSKLRLQILAQAQQQLVCDAQGVLSDRLKEIPGLDSRPVYAMDGTYQKESTHYSPCTPSQGGTDNSKGHALITIYNTRLGCPQDVYIDTRSRHEIMMLRDYAALPGSVMDTKDALWLVDRAFIDAHYWDQKKRKQGVTMITRMKKDLVIEQTKARDIKSHELNQGVYRDEEVLLKSSDSVWRLISYTTEQGRDLQFLTNEMNIEPGVIAFLYLRRWDEEKCFDTWKNDFSQSKAWGSSHEAIENQARLAIITSLVVAMFMNDRMLEFGIADEKALEKREKRVDSGQSEFVPMSWFCKLYTHTSKVSRQVLRFLKFNFNRKSSHMLYYTQLRPMLLQYI